MIRVEISVRGLVGIAAVVAGTWLFAQLWPVLLLFTVSLMFAAALLPFVEWQVRHGAGRAVAVLVVVLLLFLATALIGLLVVPVVVEQARALVERLPELREQAARALDRHGADELARRLREFSPGQLVGPATVAGAGRRVLDVFTSVITVLVLTAYILFDARRIERFLYFATPVTWHMHIRALLAQLQRVVGGYIRGQLLTSGFITVFAFVTLSALAIPNAVALAVLAGIADMVPVIGVFFVVGPATLAALSISLPRAIAVAALLVAYQEFENRVLVQRVYGATLRLPAVAVLMALLVGADLFGVMGALLSLPAAAIRVLIEYGNAVRRGSPTAPPPTEALAADGATGVTGSQQVSG